MNQNYPSAVRSDFCAVAGKCGGCQLQNMTYERQLHYKQAKVIKLLGRFCHVSEIIPAKDPLHYRNKVSAAFGTTARGQIISGIYQSSTHTIVKVESCRLEDETADRIIGTIRRLLRQFHLLPYNERDRSGFLRHVLVRKGSGGEYMVVLVCAQLIFPRKKEFISALLAEHPQIVTIIHNINDRFTSMVLGDRSVVLYGKGYIFDTLCDLQFRISPSSFYQINHDQAETLYKLAVEFAALTGEETVLDAYCGTGTIGMVCASHAKSVVGAELNPQAIADAVANAKHNHIQNIRFVCEDAGKFMIELARQNAKPDVVIADPPRAGCSKEFLQSLVAIAPKRFVYVSCDPRTQARDLYYLTTHGYKVKKIVPVDMFPYTQHVETVVQLVRKTPDMYVDFKIDLDEQDLTASEAHPTYEEIKAYIQKEYGVKVSSLYISQVKRKLGLEVGEAYNKPKSENAKQPHCPPDKEKMIVDALKHFKVV